jgi:hypothetical protein
VEQACAHYSAEGKSGQGQGNELYHVLKTAFAVEGSLARAPAAMGGPAPTSTTPQPGGPAALRYRGALAALREEAIDGTAPSYGAALHTA